MQLKCNGRRNRQGQWRPFCTRRMVAATGVNPGFQPGDGMQYTTMQQSNEYGNSPSLPVHSTAGYDAEKQHRIMEANKSPEYGVVSEGDMKAAATRVNALTALHALRSRPARANRGAIDRQGPSKHDSGGDAYLASTECQPRPRNVAQPASDSWCYLVRVLSCARDILAELHVEWPRSVLMEVFKKGELEQVIAAFTSALEKQVLSIQRSGEEGQEEQRKLRRA